MVSATERCCEREISDRILMTPGAHQNIANLLLVLELLVSPTPCQSSRSSEVPPPVLNTNSTAFLNTLKARMLIKSFHAFFCGRIGQVNRWIGIHWWPNPSVPVWFPKQKDQYFWAAPRPSIYTEANGTCWINLWHLPKPTSAKHKSLSSWHAE